MRPLLSTLLLTCLTTLQPVAAHAANWCVRNSTELQQALNAAAASPGDDEIMLREGTYTAFNGSFVYTAQNPGWLWISGGWYTVGGNDCAQMRMDASRTTLDGAEQHQVLRIALIPPAGTTLTTRLGVSNLTISGGYGNSATYQRGGGIQISSLSDAFSELRLENLIVRNNEGYYGGGADLYAKNGLVRIANSLFDHNSASASAYGHAAITLVATPANVSPAIVITNSTFARGRCAGSGSRGCGVSAGLPGGVNLAVHNSLFHDNDISDLNIEGMAVLGAGDGTASAVSSLIGSVSGNLPLGTVSPLSGDPGFVDPANGNFRLRSDSALINQALASQPYYPLGAFDLDGKPRDLFGAPDPGPYENQTWDWLFASGFES